MVQGLSPGSKYQVLKVLVVVIVVQALGEYMTVGYNMG